MSHDMALREVLSTSGGQVDSLPVHTVTTGNSVPTAAQNVTYLVTDANRRPAYLDGSGRILTGPHAGTSLLDWALKYAEMGWHVFPLREGSKFPKKNCQTCDERSDYYDRDAHLGGTCTAHAGAATCHGHLAATTDAATIRSWWMHHPHANIGINVGRSGLAILDVDTRLKDNGEHKQGEKTIAALVETHGALPEGPRVRTWSGGWQQYLIHPNGVVLKSSAGRDDIMTGLGQDVDIKALSAYAVAPPSIVTGKRDSIVQGQYTWTTDPERPCPDVPAWILQVIAEREASKRPARVRTETIWDGDQATGDQVRDRVLALADDVAHMREGARNDTLFRKAAMAFDYAAAGQISESEVEDIFISAGLAAGLDHSETIRTVTSARNRPNRKAYTWRTAGNSAPSTQNAAEGATREGQDDVDESVEIPEPRTEDETMPGAPLYSSPEAPMRVARELEHMWVTEQGRTLHHWRDTWMRWTGTHWSEIGSSALRSRLYIKLEHAIFCALDKEGKPKNKEWNPSQKKISNLVDAISAVTHLDETTEPGAWLGRKGERGLIACQNVLVHPITRITQEHTPAYFTTTAVPYAYDPAAACPEWEKFLSDVFADDTESVHALQEWAGYVISGRTDLQKGVQLIGPPRAGKGTVARILEKLIGKENSVGTTLKGLGTNFGLQPLVGMSLCVIGDAHMENRNNAEIVSRLLSIIGEDTMTVDRKNRAQWKGKMPARFMVLANKPPRFSDASGAIVTRFITIKFTQSFLGREDHGLETRLTAELPGIFNWSLDGLKRLSERGRFHQPESSEELIQIQSEGASPVKAFVDDLCVVGTAHWVTKEALFHRWQSWCHQHNIQNVGTSAAFATDLYAGIAGVRDGKQKRIKGKATRLFAGITLKVDEGMVVPEYQSAP